IDEVANKNLKDTSRSLLLVSSSSVSAGVPRRCSRRGSVGGHMAVKRIVANIATDHVEDAKAFYADILGLNLIMDLGWILTFSATEAASPQISIATPA